MSMITPIEKKDFKIDRKLRVAINPNYVEGIPERVDHAIFLQVANDSSVTLTTEEARQLADALYVQADEFDRLLEESGPKLPTSIGAIIKHKGTAYLYVRKTLDSWYGLTSTRVEDLRDNLFNPENYDVLFEGVE